MLTSNFRIAEGIGKKMNGFRNRAEDGLA